MRYGIQQDKDSFLNAINTQVNLANGSKRTLAEFKQSILKDMTDKKFDIREVDGGDFVHYFREPVTAGTEIKKKANNKRLKKRFIQNQQNIEGSAKTRFGAYLLSSERLSEDVLAPLLSAIFRFPGNETFGPTAKDNLVILIFEDINEKLKLYHWGTPDDNSVYSCHYRKGFFLEPLLYSYGVDIDPFLRCVRDKRVQVVINSYIKYITEKENTLMKVTKVSKESVQGTLLNTDDVREVTKESCHKYDRESVSEILKDLLGITIIPSKELPSSFIVDKLLDKTPYEVESRFVDPYNRITHLRYKHKEEHNTIIVPIKPEKISDKGFKDARRLSVTSYSYEEAISCLKDLDGLLQDRYADKYLLYTDNLQILLDEGEHITHLLLQGGLVIPLRSEPFDITVHRYPTRMNQGIPYISLYHLSGSSDNKYQRDIVRMNREKDEKYEIFSRCYLLLHKDSDICERIQRIRDHPLMLGIRKREKLLEMVNSSCSEECADTRLAKEFVELLITNDVNSLAQVLIHSSVSYAEIRKGNENEYVFTQRQILNEEHVPYFNEQSQYKRPIQCYDSYSLTKPSKKKPSHKDILVSFYTKYPYQMNDCFGSFKLYQHIGGDKPINYFSVTEYGVNQQDITNIDIQRAILYHIMSLDRDGISVVDLYNQRMPPESEYPSLADLLQEIQSDSYELQYWDYNFLSFCMSNSYDRNIGFAIYTNRYTQMNETNRNKFELVLAINNNILKGDRKGTEEGIQMVCLYEDYHVHQSEKQSLKNVVFFPDRDNTPVFSVSLGMLIKNKMFGRVWDRKYEGREDY